MTVDVIRGPYYSFNYKVLCITGQLPNLMKSQKLSRGTIVLCCVLSLHIPMVRIIIKELNNFLYFYSGFLYLVVGPV